jgi:DNA-binding protein HU-beta
MTKPEMITHIAQRAGITKKAATTVLETLVGSVHESLRENGGRCKIAELGTFRVLELDARRGVNPRTGKEMTIPAMKVPRFTPSKTLKALVKNGD